MNTIATTKIEEIENANNPRLWHSIKNAIMKKHVLLNLVLVFGLLAVTVLVPVGQTAQAQWKNPKDLVPPIIFQAAGPSADSIRSTVDAFRAALVDHNNMNDPGPLPLTSGHREINWDGGNPNVLDTTPPVRRSTRS